MMRGFGVGALMAVAVLGSGCVREARMAIPSEISARTERIALTGIGGWERGEFQLGSSQGRFIRHAQQRRIDDVFTENVGGGSFQASGPELGGELAARCGFHEAEVEAGAVTVTAARLSYGCSFDRNRLLVRGGLLVAEAPLGRGLLAGRTRAGELQVGDLIVGIRAVHDMEGGRVPSGTPLGYAFEINGRQIGAVDLNGSSKAIYAPVQPGPERDAVLMASIALSIFWDPGA